MLDADAVWTVGASARSDANGNYELGPLEPDTYRVAVGAPFDLADLDCTKPVLVRLDRDATVDLVQTMP